MADSNMMGKRGFAAMSAEERTEIARRGGKASGGNFKYDREKARRAGKKGGEASRQSSEQMSI